MVAPGYARAYQTQSVLTASPGQLVLMLYDGALRFVGIAQEAFKAEELDHRRIETIHKNIVKAQAIIDELQSTLDLEAGGDFARTMQRLYDYYNRRLFEANMKKDPKPLAEVEKFLREIRDAWSEMLRNQEGARAGASVKV